MKFCCPLMVAQARVSQAEIGRRIAFAPLIPHFMLKNERLLVEFDCPLCFAKTSINVGQVAQIGGLTTFITNLAINGQRLLI